MHTCRRLRTLADAYAHLQTLTHTCRRLRTLADAYAFSPKQAPKKKSRFTPGRSLPRGPPRNGTVITMVSWTYLFLEGHFFDGYWLFFSFFCFSLCYVLYYIIITFFRKNTTVNAQPLSPPNFEKIVPLKNQKSVSHVGSLRSRFFNLFIFLLIFGYPLPLPWARLVQLVIDFGAMFVRFG